MRKRSRSFATSAAVFLLTAVFLLAAAPAGAATVLARTVSIEIRPDGSVAEHTLLRVRLETDADFDDWSPYRVYLDQNRTLESLTASALKPDGKTVDVGRRDLDTEETVAPGELHSSRKFRAVRFPRVPAGSVLTVDAAVRAHPYFPAGAVRLGLSDPIASLRVEVRGGGAGWWRWRLDGKLPGLEVKEMPGGVTVTAQNLPRRPAVDLAPDHAEEGAVLRYAWGDSAGWEGVGRWYDHLVADVPRGAAPVQAKAQELTAGLSGRRKKIEALLAFVRRQVRYVAVEIGIGGYRPAAPQEVLTRRWGDCKDKAFLLIDLLRAADIEAYPVLILSAERGRVDREFPAPQFNHAIVAVPADGLGTAPEDPVAGGYLFLDATQTTGGLAWLHPGAQDQEALVVRGGQGALVHTPVRQQREKVRLALDVAAAADGQLAGTARLELTGQPGDAFVDLVAAGRTDEVDRAARRLFERYLPGVKLDPPRWTTDETSVPAAVLTANVRLPAPSTPSSPGGWPAYALSAVAVMPSLGVLDDRELPVVASPFTEELAWTVTLGDGACPPAPGQDVEVSNSLGSYRQKVSLAGTKLTVERRSELRKRWIEPADFPALKEIALAESRTGKRRLRWECR
ncbi:MAG TPA: transglutaminase domain-containing protein [Thermoanaerobaculia bacterium]|jgi:hypothetical protein|nr:transglutaminase domain-containing protein [Thermoanaerobaculia bacterium]